MRWWEAAVGAGGGGGVVAVAVRMLRNHRIRAMVRGAVSGKTTVDELVLMLDQQRQGYEHLAGRVDRLEAEIARLEEKLAEARRREEALEVALAEERRVSGQRIAALEVELAAARMRIAELEAQLARYHPDGRAPGER